MGTVADSFLTSSSGFRSPTKGMKTYTEASAKPVLLQDRDRIVLLLAYHKVINPQELASC